MNSKQAAIILSAAAFILAPLVFSPSAEAKGGYEHRDSKRHGHPKHHRPHRSHKHHHGSHHRYYHMHPHHGYYYYPYYDYNQFILGLHWPYGFSIYYLDR